MHLHLLDEVLGLATTFVGNLGVLVQNEAGKSQEEHGDDREGVRPGDDVELGVHEPVAAVSVDAEDQNAEEQEHRRRGDRHERDGRQQPFVAQDCFQRPAADFTSHDSESKERIDEGESDERLNRHQPPGQQVLADHVVFLR